MKLIALVILLLNLSLTAQSVTFDVTTLLDEADLTPGDGVCNSTSGCSLRAAIIEANATIEADEILLPEGEYVLTLAGTDSTADLGDLDIKRDLTIRGQGPDKTIINGDSMDRIFEVPWVNFTLEDLSVINGSVDGSDGNSGAGILFSGIDYVLNIRNVHFVGNTANNGAAIWAGRDTIVDISQSLFEDNNTVDLGMSRDGAAIQCLICNNVRIDSSLFTGNNDGDNVIWVASGGSAEVINSTFSQNQTTAIRSQNGNVKILFSTFDQNQYNLSFFSFDDSHSFTVGASIFNNSSFVNCSSSDIIVSEGYNIDSDNSCMFTELSDQTLVDPLLSDMSHNGYILPTHKPQISSPAIDAIADSDCLDLEGLALLVDQRQSARPQNSLCDIGAFETNPDVQFQSGFD